MSEKKRSHTIKVRISDILNSKFIHGNKETMKPSYIITRFGKKISRVNLLGTIIDKFTNEDGTYSSITVDDSTEAIKVKAFKDNLQLLAKTEIGQIVSVTGKLKEYNGEVYVVAEIVRTVEDLNFENLHKLEILRDLKEQDKILTEIRNLYDKLSQEDLENYVKDHFVLDKESLDFIISSFNLTREIDYEPKLLEVIENLDEGQGVEFNKIFTITDLPENVVESVITNMLASGILTEPRPGILKKV